MQKTAMVAGCALALMAGEASAECVAESDVLRLGYPFESDDIAESIRGSLDSLGLSFYAGVSPRLDLSFVRDDFSVFQDVDFPLFMDKGQMDFELDVALENVCGARLNLMLPLSLVGRGGLEAAAYGEFDNTYRFAPVVALNDTCVRSCIGLYAQLLSGGMFQSGPERFDDVAAWRFGTRFGIDYGEDLIVSLLYSNVVDIGVSGGTAYGACDLDAILSLQADGFCWRFIGSYDIVSREDQYFVEQGEFRIERPIDFDISSDLLYVVPFRIVPSAGIRSQTHSVAGNATYNFYGLEAQLGFGSSHLYFKWEYDDVNDTSFRFGVRLSAPSDD